MVKWSLVQLWEVPLVPIPGFYPGQGRHQEKKKRDLTQSWRKPLYQQKSQQAIHNTMTPPKNIDYTTIANRTVSWSNNSHQTGVVKPGLKVPTAPLTAKVV